MISGDSTIYFEVHLTRLRKKSVLERTVNAVHFFFFPLTTSLIIFYLWQKMNIDDSNSVHSHPSGRLSSYIPRSRFRVSVDKVSCDKISDDKVSEDKMSGGDASCKKVSSDTVSGDNFSGDKVLIDTVSGDKVLDDNVSDNYVSRETISGQKVSSYKVAGDKVSSVTRFQVIRCHVLVR